MATAQDSHHLSLLARTQVGEVRPVATIELPQEFRDRYELGEVLGSGAMGMVCRARDRSMNREVAVKFLMLIDQPELLGRFLQEGRMLARIRHPNVVPVYDLENLGGHPYIVTECLEGGTLRRRIDERSLTPAAALEVMAACLDGLAACHASQIVHRDLKPENILFAADDSPKISDLGIAKELAGNSVTRTGALLGTPTYMAPEQAEMNTATFASDVHAMGAILFEIVAGRPPFVASNLADLLRDIMTVVPPALDACTNVALPPALVRVVARALSKLPEERPGVEEFAAELRKAGSSRSLAPRAPDARRPRGATPLGGVAVVATRAAAGAGGRHMRAIAAGVAIGFMGIVLAAALRRRVPPAHAPEPAGAPVAAQPSPSHPAPPSESDLRGMRLDLQRIGAACVDCDAEVTSLSSMTLRTLWTESDAARADSIEARYLELSVQLRALRSKLEPLDPWLEAGPPRLVALGCYADTAAWQIRTQAEALARFRTDRLEQSRMAVQPKASLSVGVPVRTCTLEDSMRLQQIARRLRRALLRPYAQLAADPQALAQLLEETRRVGALVEKHCNRAYQADTVALARMASGAPPDPQATRVGLALERITLEMLGILEGVPAAPETRLERVIAGLYLVGYHGYSSQMARSWKPRRLSASQLKQAVLDLESTLGPAGKGCLAGLIPAADNTDSPLGR